MIVDGQTENITVWVVSSGQLFKKNVRLVENDTLALYVRRNCLGVTFEIRHTLLKYTIHARVKYTQKLKLA